MSFFTFFSPPFCADPLRKGHVPLQIVGDDIDLRGLIKLASMNLSVRHTFDWLYKIELRNSKLQLKIPHSSHQTFNKFNY